MNLELSKDRIAELVPSIQRYFTEKLDTEIGNLPAEFLLEFFAREIGPSIYNQAVRDVQIRLQQRVLELDSVCFEVEEGYWEVEERKRKGRGS